MTGRGAIVAQRLLDKTGLQLENDPLTDQDFMKAQMYLNAALQKDSTNIRCYLMGVKLLQIKIKNSRTAKDKNRYIVDAIQALQHAASLDSNNFQVKVLLAEFNLALQNSDLALQFATQALTLGPSQKALEIKADCLVDKKDITNALGCYVEALKQDPVNNELLAKKAYCLMKQGLLQEAMSAVEASLKYMPNYGTAINLKNEINKMVKKQNTSLSRVS